MKSTKILTINPQPSGVNQKLVPAKKYNELWEDVAGLEQSLFSSNFGYPKELSFTVLNGLAVSNYDAGGGQAVYVSARDLLNGIHYTGTQVLYYAINTSGATPSGSDWKLDARDAYVASTSGAGAVAAYVFIKAGLDGLPNKTTTYFLA